MRRRQTSTSRRDNSTLYEPLEPGRASRRSAVVSAVDGQKKNLLHILWPARCRTEEHKQKTHTRVKPGSSHQHSTARRASAKEPARVEGAAEALKTRANGGSEGRDRAPVNQPVLPCLRPWPLQVSDGHRQAMLGVSTRGGGARQSGAGANPLPRCLAASADPHKHNWRRTTRRWHAYACPTKLRGMYEHVHHHRCSNSWPRVVLRNPC